MITVSQPRLYTPEERKYYVVIERENPLPDWDYMREVTIDNTQNSNTLSDFQVQITLDTASLISNGKMKSDCGDVRVYDPNTESLLPYWVESGTENTSSTKIWVKVPSIPGGGKKTIYLFYGNPDATSKSNATATFDFYDDFEGTSLDTSKWDIYNSPSISISDSVMTISGEGVTTTPDFIKSKATFGYDYILEAYVNQDFTDGSAGGIGFAEGNGYTYPPSTNVAMYIDCSSSTNTICFVTEDGANRNIYEPGSYTGGWTTFILKRTSSSVYFKFASYEWTSTSYLPSGDLPIHVGGYESDVSSAQSFSFQVDWIRVRKYADPEPTTSVGVEQPGGDIKMKVERSW